MALDAWSGTIGAFGAAAVTAIVGLIIKNRDLKAARNKETDAAEADAAKTLETAFDKSEGRREKQLEEYKELFKEVADLKTKVALQGKDIETLTREVGDLRTQLDGKSKELERSRAECSEWQSRALKAEADCEIYRVGMDSMTMMLDAASGAKIDEGFLAIANDKAKGALALSRQQQTAHLQSTDTTT